MERVAERRMWESRSILWGVVSSPVASQQAAAQAASPVAAAPHAAADHATADHATADHAASAPPLLRFDPCSSLSPPAMPHLGTTHTAVCVTRIHLCGTVAILPYHCMRRASHFRSSTRQPRWCILH